MIRLVYAWLRCRLGNHRWVVAPIVHPSVPSLNGWRLHWATADIREPGMGELTVGSTFTGVGGIDLGFEQAGRFRTVWMSEVDRHASEVLTHHWPEVPNYGDINAIGCVCVAGQTGQPAGNGHGDGRIAGPLAVGGGSPVLRAADRAGTEGDHCGECGRVVPGRVDVIVGGFPCQDYSVAGNRGGLAGDRGALWWQLHRLIGDVRPTWFVGENVPGLLSSNGGRDFRTIIESLGELGYGVVWRVLDSQWFGVPQRRRRVVIVGHSGGRPRPEVLAVAESLSGNPEPSRETGQGVAGGVGGGAASSSAGNPDDNRAQGGFVVAPEAGQPASSSGRDTVGTVTTAFGPKNATNHQEVSQGSLVAHGAFRQVRRLTPLECERLQGFPDGWTDNVSDTQRYRQMGNAVTVPVFRWVGERIAEAHDAG